MFGNNKKETPHKTSANGQEPGSAGSINLIGQGTVIKGTIETEGDLRIEGQFEGTLNSRAKLVLGDTAHVNGEVTCQNADISGHLEGTIKVNEVCVLKSNANVKAELYTRKLVIENGAIFNGHCDMQTNEEKTPSLEQPKKEAATVKKAASNDR